MKFPLLLVVIQETIIDAVEVLRRQGSPQYLFSYHAVIETNGRICYLVPATESAFGVKASYYFNVETGEKEQIKNSVNDFSYHIALETPIDGRNKTLSSHSGYSIEQYNSLAWLIRATGVNLNRLVKYDELFSLDGTNITSDSQPRSLDFNYLTKLVQLKTNSKSIDFGILDYTKRNEVNG